MAANRPRPPATSRPATTPATGKPTIAELADHLCTVHCTDGPNLVGAPTAATTLRAAFGSCSMQRARAAKDEHKRRHTNQSTTDQPSSEEGK